MQWTTTVAQQNNVGINTAAPLTKFHIDGQKNTTSNTTALTKDDFFVTSNGSIGIGVSEPKVRLDLRNLENTDGIIAIGNSTQTAAEAKPGALRYFTNNELQYSNGTEWVTVANSSTTKTVVAATKDTWGSTAENVFCYGGGFNSNQSLIPNRAPCYIRLWSVKHDNNAGGGAFNNTTGQFSASRAGVFTATFTFALNAANVNANPSDANQVEAIWRHLRNGIEINSVKCANTYASNSTGNVRLGSSCTASFDMQPNDVIRPEIWIDVSPTSGATQAASSKRQFDISNSGAYNNLTIIEN